MGTSAHAREPAESPTCRPSCNRLRSPTVQRRWSFRPRCAIRLFCFEAAGTGEKGPPVSIELLAIDGGVLDELVDAAVDGARPEEVMPPVEGPPGWTPQRREALRSYHRVRHSGLGGPERELGFAISDGSRVVGAARLCEVQTGTLEAGVWLVNRARGHGMGTQLLAALAHQARAAGARRLIAETTAANHAAIGALRRTGFTLSTYSGDDSVHAELPLRSI